MSQVEVIENERLNEDGNKPSIILCTCKREKTGRDARAPATSRVSGGKKH